MKKILWTIILISILLTPNTIFATDNVYYDYYKTSGDFDRDGQIETAFVRVFGENPEFESVPKFFMIFRNDTMLYADELSYRVNGPKLFERLDKTGKIWINVFSSKDHSRCLEANRRGWFYYKAVLGYPIICINLSLSSHSGVAGYQYCHQTKSYWLVYDQT